MNMACRTVPWLLLLVFASSTWAQEQPTPESVTSTTSSTQQSGTDQALQDVNNRYQFSSLEVCKWPSFPPALNSPTHSIEYFANANSWNYKDWEKWIESDHSKYTPSAVFFVMSVASLLILLLWRAVHCCCIRCCRRASPAKYLRKDPYAVGLYAWYRRNNSSTAMMWLKPVVLLLCLLSIAICVFGLTRASKGHANNIWDNVTAVSSKFTQVGDDAEALVSAGDDVAINIKKAPAKLEALTTATNNKEAWQQLQTAIAAATKGTDALDQNKGIWITNIESFRNGVVSRIDKGHSKLYDPSQKWDKAAFIATIVQFCLAMAFLVMLLGAMLLNIPGLFTFCTIFLAIFSMLFFYWALGGAIVMAGARDVCPAAETIIKASIKQWSLEAGVHDGILGLVNFYFFKAFPDLSTALSQTNMINLPDINQLLQGGTQLLKTFTAAYPEGSQQPAAVQQQLTELYQLFGVINTDLSAVAQALSKLTDDASFEAVNNIYFNAKSYVCCTAINDILQLWKALTLAGWALLVMGWFCNAIISQYDKAPGAERSCCGCTRLGPFTDGGHTDAADGGAQKPMSQPAAVVAVKGVGMPRLKV